jgi:hypothetical protein
VRRAGSIAVALHDVEPATVERCALIRDWLDDHGIARVTLLVIPAPDLHPFNDRRPEMVQWLAECVDPRYVERREAAGLAVAGARRRLGRGPPAAGSTCIPPTSAIRATSAPWRGCCSAPTAASATPSPTTTSRSEQPPWLPTPGAA